MKVIPHPCYDEHKKKDCPDRSMDCHITCKKWKEYEQERDAEYDRRKLESCAKPVYSTRKERALKRWMKRH
jgi:hypothetical protein